MVTNANLKTRDGGPSILFSHVLPIISNVAPKVINKCRRNFTDRQIENIVIL